MTRIYVKIVADLFHPGHVRFLAAARALGDHLTACVVPDERVAAGKGRAPVMTVAERAEVVAACRHVDAVITNGPRIITRAFMDDRGFDIYAFGAVDAVELNTKLAECADLPEHRRAQLPYSPGISTTQLIRRIAERREAAGDSVRRALPTR